MLVTLVIGLREGLEAALIVAIIATFLTRARASLRPMWWGVGAAVAAYLLARVMAARHAAAVLWPATATLDVKSSAF